MTRNISQSKTILFIAALVLCIGRNRADAQVLTMDSMITMIREKHPLLQAYDYQIQALHAYEAGATSWSAPMVGAGPYWYPYPGKKITEDRDKGFWMFSVEQDVPNPMKLRTKKEFLTSKADIESLSKQQEYNVLRSQAKELYYRWFVLEKKRNAILESERISSSILSLARLRYAHNQGSLGDIYKAEAKLHEVENNVSINRSGIDAVRSQLKMLLGMSPQATITIDTTMDMHLDLNKVASDTAFLVRQRSDLRQIDKMIASAELNQRYQKSQLRPDVRIRFDHMVPRGSSMPQQFTLMAMVSIPIAPWSSRMNRSEISGLNYEIESLKRKKAGMLLQAQGAVTSMLIQLAQHDKQLDNYQQKIIPALRRNYQAVMLSYEENQETLPVVMDAWEALNIVQMEYFDQLSEHYKMIVDYEQQVEK